MLKMKLEWRVRKYRLFRFFGFFFKEEERKGDKGGSKEIF